MRNKEKEFDSTTNNRVYKSILNAKVSKCPICPPHKGCNRRRRKLQKSWKYFRKTRYKGL